MAWWWLCDGYGVECSYLIVVMIMYGGGYCMWFYRSGYGVLMCNNCYCVNVRGGKVY